MRKQHPQYYFYRPFIIRTLHCGLILSFILLDSLVEAIPDLPPGVSSTSQQKSWFSGHQKKKGAASTGVKAKKEDIQILPDKPEPLLRLPAALSAQCPAGMYLVPMEILTDDRRKLTLIRQNQPCLVINVHLTSQESPEPVRVGVEKKEIPPSLSTKWIGLDRLVITVTDHGKHFESDPLSVSVDHELLPDGQ